jgi:iron complex outermembrane receptor protein
MPAQTALSRPAASSVTGEQAGATAEVERVIVTGSNIPTSEEVGPNPLFSLDRDLINKSGQGTTTEQLLKTQPVMNASSVPVQNNGTSQSGPAGSASISLRGFDPGATLVLIDGRRVVPFAVAANSGYSFFDVTTIPVTAVQSVDILKDGASTTYGADAVAGVVNLKFYKDYRGAQVTLQYGNTLDKEAGEYLGDILFGTGDDRTSITGDIFYYHHDSMFNRDRGNSARPPFLSSNSSPWNLQLQVAAIIAAGGTPYPTTSPREFGTPPNFSNGSAPASDYIYYTSRVRAFGGLLPGFNLNAYSSSWPMQERWGGYTSFESKICDDQLRIYGDFYYVDANTHDELAPKGTGSFEAPGEFTIYVPPNHPFPGGVPPFGGPTSEEVGMPRDAYNPFNPFEQIISGGSRARLFDFGNRSLDNQNIAERFTVGVKGDKLFNGTWGYDGAFVYSQLEQIERLHAVSLARFVRILNANDSLFNPASGDFIGQTIPYNPFGDAQHVVIPTNLPLIDFASLDSKDFVASKLATLDLNIYTTDLLDLPAGPIGFAFGGSFSRETYIFNTDDETRLAESGGVRVPPVRAGRKEYALYSEVLIPVFSPKWNIPGFHSLEFTAGARFESWLNNDTNALVPKVGARWQPFDDQLTLRSTWGEGFLEPSMLELYGPFWFVLGPAHFVGFAPSAIFGPPGSPTNPLQDVADPETIIEQFPSNKLAPEHDRTWTGGFVYTPKWIPRTGGSLTLTIDFWDVERTGVVTFASPNVVIAGYKKGIYPGVVQPAEPPHNRPSVLFDPEGDYVGVVSPFINGGRMRSNGVDLSLQYQIETGIGIFTALSRWSYLNEFVFNFPGERPRQVAGRANTDWFAGSFFGDVTTGDGWLKWKGVTSLDWTWHNFDMNWTIRFLDGFWEEIYAKQFDGFWKQHYVHPTWFTDAQLSYSLIFTPPVEAAPVPGYSKGGKEVVGKEKEAPPVPYAMPCWKTILNNTTITVGVNNIFGEDPPHAFGFELGNSVGYPGSLYDNLGRFVYGRLTKKF